MIFYLNDLNPSKCTISPIDLKMSVKKLCQEIFKKFRNYSCNIHPSTLLVSHFWSAIYKFKNRLPQHFFFCLELPAWTFLRQLMKKWGSSSILKVIFFEILVKTLNFVLFLLIIHNCYTIYLKKNVCERICPTYGVFGPYFPISKGLQVNVLGVWLGVWPWNFYQMSSSIGRCKICKKLK